MTLLIIVVALALIFDLINGFHDAANSIATIVSTKVLTPFQAVAWAALFNFLAYLVFGLHVANTIGKGIVHPETITLQVVLAGLIGAITWNLVTWWFGIPSSSSHTLIGGFVGAAVAHAGFSVIFLGEVLRIIAFIFLAPVIGMMTSILISGIVILLSRNLAYGQANSIFKRLQLISSAMYSLGHGANDAQKVMGIIFASLIAANMANATDHIPFWVVLSCQSAMAIGTLMGGWRIVKTMGTRITHLRSFEGFSAETGGAITLFATGMLGIPVSTTHTITGAIIGAGLTKRLSAVRWGVTKSIIIAWIITIPITSFLSAFVYYLTKLIL
ncbi:MAG: inorganic phosphate transporter [Niastella sp. SCN 39-18]|nr:inorganic phosphate transporter [Sphingobacteriales bacterium]ODT52293.1 MAG: inorganic phosphate transporter [Niastella sp. SCN 39-18]OJW10501.1 MAG: anion permease [Sphingobacteriales bacterium 39-19]